MLASHKDLAKKLANLEQKYNAKFKVVFDAIRQLMLQNPTKKKQIGFTVGVKTKPRKGRKMKLKGGKS